MARLFILFFLFLVCLSSIKAQRDLEQKNAIINLHDGSVLIGDVISEDHRKLSLVIYTGDTLSIDRRLIAKSKDNAEDLIIHNNGKYHYRKGFFWNLGLGFNSFTESRPSSHLNVLIGQRINTKLSLGAGLAFEYNRALVSGLTFDTQFNVAYAYGRYYITDSRPRYFVYSRLGYGFPVQDDGLTDEHTGGFQFQNGIGMHFASNKKARFVMALGHHFQNTSGEESFIDVFGNEVISMFDILISRAILKFSIEFK